MIMNFTCSLISAQRMIILTIGTFLFLYLYHLLWPRSLSIFNIDVIHSSISTSQRWFIEEFIVIIFTFLLLFTVRLLAAFSIPFSFRRLYRLLCPSSLRRTLTTRGHFSWSWWLPSCLITTIADASRCAMKVHHLYLWHPLAESNLRLR